MTLGDAILKSCIIGDFNRDSYTRTQYAAVADMAQKMLAAVVSKIVKTYSVTVSGEAEVTLPKDFTKLVRVRLKNSGEFTNYQLSGNRLYIIGTGEYEICYEAVPSDIKESKSDFYVFEIPQYAHFAIPYYMVYQLLKATDAETAQVCLNEWNRLLSVLGNAPVTVSKVIENCY